MKTCVLCKMPIYRPQTIHGGTTPMHWNCTEANKIAPPLPTPIADSIQPLICEIVPKIKNEQYAEFGALLRTFEEDKYEEERGNPAPIQNLKNKLEKFQ